MIDADVHGHGALSGGKHTNNTNINYLFMFSPLYATFPHATHSGTQFFEEAWSWRRQT